MASLTSHAADHKTLELVTEHGAAQTDLDPLFDALEPDGAGQVDGVRDTDNMPLASEPQRVLDDLNRVRERRRRTP